MLLTLLFFILAIFMLVTIHEYGHFQVARWCGVKVLRFSFGFATVLARWRDKKGTEYAWSLLPLGGYVKMLDESEGDVAENERHLAFNNQTLLKRAAIVIAGPLFNFLFAFIALWLVLVIGMYSLAPIIDSVKPNSVAAQVGLKAKEEIVALDGTKINSWRDFQYQMMPFVGSEETVKLTVKSLIDGQHRQVLLPLSAWHFNNKNPDLLQSLGIEPFVPAIPPIVGEVVLGSPAEKSGLQSGDKITKLNGKTLSNWLYLVEYIRSNPDTRFSLTVNRKGKFYNLTVQTNHLENKGKIEGYLGVRSQQIKWPDHWLRVERQGPMQAVSTALKQTIQLTKTTFILMGRLVTGKLGLNSISGPVGIAQGAGDSGRGGLVSYLFFLALVSISLGALNILPIPMLDGGHLFYYLLEAILGKPLPNNLKVAGSYLGLLILAALMMVALTNDFSKLVS